MTLALSGYQPQTVLVVPGPRHRRASGSPRRRPGSLPIRSMSSSSRRPRSTADNETHRRRRFRGRPLRQPSRGHRRRSNRIGRHGRRGGPRSCACRGTGGIGDQLPLAISLTQVPARRARAHVRVALPRTRPEDPPCPGVRGQAGRSLPRPEPAHSAAGPGRSGRYPSEFLYTLRRDRLRLRRSRDGSAARRSRKGIIGPLSMTHDAQALVVDDRPVDRPLRCVDPFGREISYLRVSVTDRCDFRCVYCMAENMTFLPKADLLTLEELDRLCSAFIARGRAQAQTDGRRAAGAAWHNDAVRLAFAPSRVAARSTSSPSPPTARSLPKYADELARPRCAAHQYLARYARCRQVPRDHALGRARQGAGRASMPRRRPGSRSRSMPSRSRA